MSDPTEGIWEQEPKPGLVPRGFAEKTLEQVVKIEDTKALWWHAAKLAGWAQAWNGHGLERREIKSAQMFVEIQLGQLLGPSPGHGPGRGHEGKDPHGDVLPEQRIADFRRYYGHMDELIEAVRNGKMSRRSLLLHVDELLLNESGDREEIEVRAGDFADALADIEPDSVSLVLTDPPYAREYLPLWDDLGEWAAEHLVDGGSLVAYCGQSILPDVLERLNRSLRYWWTIALIHGQSQMIPGKWVSAGWKPVVWFVKDKRSNKAMLADTIKGGTARKTMPTGDDGSWAQSVDPVLPIISALIAPGDLIVDPFAGSGTFGEAATRLQRRFVGADING